jgi:hypothetical protein
MRSRTASCLVKYILVFDDINAIEGDGNAVTAPTPDAYADVAGTDAMILTTHDGSDAAVASIPDT